ncbi:MAG: alpha-L-rhamnosidase N-terminal domain-containing protein, partial [Bacteroidaceae bacterium]|nr:alpha-L-rhamnosidase N-terminal domain-containing protein [Bacteroidaceae bacterium]
MKNYTANTLFAVVLALLIVSCGKSPQNDVMLINALNNSAWDSSQWISVVDAPVVTDTVVDGSRAADGASWFVTTITNEQKVVSAKWMTTGLGVYDLYVNGEIIGKEILKPGFTHYIKTKRSFTYDITNVFLKKSAANNTLAVMMTPGWWADKIVTPGGAVGMNGKKCAFRGVLELTFSDGSQKLYGTNTKSWKAGIAGPVKHAAIFDGEVYDAREMPDSALFAQFAAPEINTEFNGEILPTNGAEIYLRTDLALNPVKAYTWEGIRDSSEE